jgi:hypothetical protein
VELARPVSNAGAWPETQYWRGFPPFCFQLPLIFMYNLQVLDSGISSGNRCHEQQ